MEAKTCNGKVAILYVDFRKVFHSFDGGKMLQIIKLYDEQINFLTAISMLYGDTLARMSPDGRDLRKDTTGTWSNGHT